MREHTQTAIVWYSEDDAYHKHPNHQRTFMSKNLWCMNCKGMCACCQIDCCIHEQSLFYIKHGHKELKTAKKEGDPEMEAMGRLRQANGKAMLADIEKYLATGPDDSTFLECTNCHWFVCPRCVGICSESQCRDQQCKRCLEAQASGSKPPKKYLKGRYPEYNGPDPFGKCDIHN